MTGFYDRYCAPALVSFACSLKPIAMQRAKVVPQASGRVLEIGFGSGHNLPYYDHSKVAALVALEPDGAMRARAKKRLAASPLKVEMLALKAERIPLDAASVDAIVMTYTLCTISDPTRALAEMRRVLKPGGALLFCEHGLAPDARVARRQNQFNRVWGKIAGGCNLNRDIAGLIAGAGFDVARKESMYLPGTPRTLGFNIWGVARPAPLAS